MPQDTPTKSRLPCTRLTRTERDTTTTGTTTDCSISFHFYFISILLFLFWYVCAYSMHSLTRKHGHRHSQRLEQQLRYELLHNIEQSRTITHTQPQCSPCLTHGCVSCSQFDRSPHTLHCLSVYSYIIHRTKGREREKERETDEMKRKSENANALRIDIHIDLCLVAVR